MKNITLIILLIGSLVFVSNINGQEKKYFVAANWNLENLFDTEDDPAKNDDEFTPSSEKKWDQEKLDKKLSNISKVILSMNDGIGPDILSVEEVEHKALLDTLVKKYTIAKNYKVAYAESPDERGIDVGLIYNSDIFNLISIITDTVNLPDKWPTRLILNVNLLTRDKDTISVFVNHWPSRRGGETESEVNRLMAALVLRTEVNKLFLRNYHAKIIILGDFNDEPNNKSISETLNAKDFDCSNISQVNSKDLFNLAYKKSQAGEGTYLYQLNWNMLDQIIVSGGLLQQKYICDSFEIYKPEIMVTRSGKFKGAAFPTYGGGNRYLGGYSDHFPVIAKFLLK
ncbi:MAG: hypothetical protein NTX22_06940 [Ignavibacteriales bacterium]|nr:hypothetical protein [Ignavibacteriales bacterium]